MAATGATQHTAKCQSCGRIRRFGSAGTAATAQPYGRTCLRKIRAAAVDAALEGFTPAQRDKAAELIADGGLVPTSRPGVYRASGSKGDVTYLVHSAVCSCPAALHGRDCYHLLAARIVAACGSTRKVA
jgi:hypothetical protein